MKKYIASLTVALMLIPGAVFADVDTTAQLQKLEFSQIEEEISNRNPQYQKIEDSIEDADASIDSGSKAIKDAIEGITIIEQDYVSEHGTDLTLDQVIVTLLESQKAGLEAQLGALPDMHQLKTQGNQGEDQIVAGVQTLFITYNSVGRQLEELQANRNVLNLQLEAMKIKVQLGMDIQLNLDDTENKLRALDASIQAVQNAYDKLKHQLNLAVGQEYDTEMEIGDNPIVQAAELEAIDVASDYLEAQNYSYDIELNEDEYNYVIEDSYRQFESSFYEIYENVKTKKLALDSEEQSLKVAKTSFDFLELKYNLGMVSMIQYEQGKVQFKTQEDKYAEAQDALYKAYNNYQWAKRGLILSSTATTSS